MARKKAVAEEERLTDKQRFDAMKLGPRVPTGKPADSQGNVFEMHRKAFGSQSDSVRSRGMRFGRGQEKPLRSRRQRGISRQHHIFNSQTGHRIMPVSLYLRGMKR